ncbi:MAG TPA: protein translocase subunit SecD [Jatrophihabitans sp.]|nr:protein translocase subunit SecD [Jatrophihabitans sp.]
MAPPPGTLRVGRYFLALGLLLLVLYALIVFPGQRHTPKLGIDLVGGLRVVFTAQTPPGAPPPTSSQMSQARQIMEDRINTYGVTGATVVVQGGDQLVIEIPSGTGADVEKLGQAAILNFRGIMAPAQPILCSNQPGAGAPSGSSSPSGSTSPSGGNSPSAGASGSASKGTHDKRDRPLTAPTSSTPKSTPSGSTPPGASTTPTTPATTPTATTPAAPPACVADPFAALIKADASLKPLLTQAIDNPNALNAEQCPSPSMPDYKPDTPAPCHAYSDLSATQQQEITTALQTYKCSSAQSEADIAYSYYIACDQSNRTAFLLGHVVVKGQQISSAAAQAPNTSGVGGSVDWTVALKLHSDGADAWHAWTSKYNFPQADTQNVTPVQTPGSTTAPCGPSATLPCSDFVAFTLDGQVISFPVTLAVLDVNTSISGNFDQTSANDLAKELNYGKLPLNFRAEENNKVSATLGDKQLRAAFIAGGIGLGLVILYSFIYYRALGLVTISSLLVSGALTYAMLVILSKQIGFTLDLAGIAGFIVALGITADSFVVFFERIKDEVHEGRSLRVAVPRAWVRARRTILSADTVSFLAAAILYYFASADVKGFAFTLGMSTILDLVVVFLFTHPMISMLSRMRAFGSPRFTGLSSVRVGGIATTDDEPLPERRRSPLRARRAGAGESSQGSAVAVAEREDDEPAAEPESDTEPSVGSADEPPPPERRRTAPEPGSAAERAAARRARLREQGDGKEQR